MSYVNKDKLIAELQATIRAQKIEIDGLHLELNGFTKPQSNVINIERKLAQDGAV